MSNTFRNKKVGSYFGAFFALLVIALAIYYFIAIVPLATVEGAALYNILAPWQLYTIFALLLAGGVLYLVSFFFNLDKLGAGVMGTLCFVSFILYIIPVLAYPISQMMVYPIDQLFQIPHLITVLIIPIGALLLAIICNVLAYCPLVKRNDTITSDYLYKILTEGFDFITLNKEATHEEK